jgi:cytochrome c biogenesis protein CcmG/thiol:disulfide interchange protein DsbE
MIPFATRSDPISLPEPTPLPEPTSETNAVTPCIRGWRRAAAVVALLALAACLPEGSGPPRAGDALPALTARSLEGEPVSLASYRGEGVLLNLWATWCPPCRAEMPYFQELSREFGPRGLRVVGVSVDNAGARDLLEAFLVEAGIDYDILLDPGMTSMDQLGVLGLPATFLVDPQGVVRHVRAGPVQEGDTAFLREIEAILPGVAP